MAALRGSAGDGVSRCTVDEIDELLKFQTRVQPERSRPLDADRIRWFFGPNPSRSGDELSMWISRREGRIVGALGAVEAQLSVAGELVPAAWSVELLVDEEWRGTGVAEEVSVARQHALGDRATCALGISDAGHRFALRRGYVEMHPVATYIWIADASRLWHGAPRALAGIARPIARVALGVARGLCRLRGRRAELVPFEHFDERADNLWRLLAPAYPVIARRDAAWLGWRFDACPDRADYQRYHLIVDGVTAGYVVLQPLLRGEERFLSVVDYLAQPRDLAALFGSVVLRAGASGAAGVECRSVHPAAIRALRSLGFVRRRRQDVRFMLLARAEDPHRSVLVDSGWHVTAADSDLD